MPLVGYEQLAEKRHPNWRKMTVSFAAFALILSLASRVSTATFSKTPIAHSASSTAKIQHLDKDSLQWAGPTTTFSVLWATESAIILQTTKKIPQQLQDDSLHNRPPPVS
jgi:hypothetical protein